MHAPETTPKIFHPQTSCTLFLLSRRVRALLRVAPGQDAHAAVRERPRAHRPAEQRLARRVVELALLVPGTWYVAPISPSAWSTRHRFACCGSQWCPFSPRNASVALRGAYGLTLPPSSRYMRRHVARTCANVASTGSGIRAQTVAAAEPSVNTRECSARPPMMQKIAHVRSGRRHRRRQTVGVQNPLLFPKKTHEGWRALFQFPSLRQCQDHTRMGIGLVDVPQHSF